MREWLRKVFGAGEIESPRPTDNGQDNPHDHVARRGEAAQQRPARRRPPADRSAGPGVQDLAPVPDAAVPPAPEPPGRSTQLTAPLTLERVEECLAAMEYTVSHQEDEGHTCLLGTWDDYPFVIESPDGHPGWLLISGDWPEAAASSERDEIAASVNDWNRDKFFPTVAIIDGPAGSFVRATYLTDLRAGVTDRQLHLHIDTGLASCIQALSQVGPLLPEL